MHSLVPWVTKTVPPVAEKKLKFAMTDEEIARVPITETPVDIQEFCTRITEIAQNPKMSVLSTSKITDWLVEKGHLRTENGLDGKKKPTSLAVGIFVDERSSSRFGMYQVMIYDKSGQEFILKHLQEILKSDFNSVEKERNTVQCNRVYRHFKGKLYYVHDLVIHTETEEEMVSYQALYHPYGMFVRPKNMFIEVIDPNRPDNPSKQVHRFELFHPTIVEGE